MNEIFRGYTVKKCFMFQIELKKWGGSSDDNLKSDTNNNKEQQKEL